MCVCVLNDSPDCSLTGPVRRRGGGGEDGNTSRDQSILYIPLATSKEFTP